MTDELSEASAAELVHGLRQSLGATQDELARRAGVDRALIARIERGREPLLPTLRTILAACGGRLELVARFERPLETLLEELIVERDAAWRRRWDERRQAIR